MDNKYIKPNPLLIIMGLLGLMVFILLLNRFYPTEAANMNIGKDEAIDIAGQFLKSKGYKLNGYFIDTMYSYNSNAFTYHHRRHGWEKTQEAFKNGFQRGLTFNWRVSWLKNLPKSAQYEQFQVNVTGSGELYYFHHTYPVTRDWPENRKAHISQEEALGKARAFLAARDFSLDKFEKDSFNTKKYAKRTDHVFDWRGPIANDDGKVILQITVQGDEIGRFSVSFGIPVSESSAINQAEGRKSFSGFVSYIFAFLFCIVLQFFFLRKYHEGEVSVKTATVLFFIIWLTLAAESILKIRIFANAASIGEMPFNTVGIAITILLALVVWPFFSIMGFSAWSVSESLGRSRFNRKFTALDSLLSRKWFTLNAASSILNGYMGGFLGLGLLSVLIPVTMGLPGGSLDMVDYRIASTPLPFLVPPLAALSSALLSEFSFRLFGNLILYRLFKRRWLALVLSGLPWTLFAIGFWSFPVSFYPMAVDWIFIYIVGTFLGILFWKFDLLTSLTAHFTIIGVMFSLPMLTAGASGIFYQGVAALIIIFLPVVLIIGGFIHKSAFSFEADLTPQHIKRITQRARMAKELEIARQVQMSLLPEKAPEFKGLEIEGTCIPALEVGGDYYDFIPLPDSRMGVVIGDVSGKGVPAAIYMTLTKGIIQSQTEHRQSPCEVLTRVNRSLYKMMEKRSFVTLFYAIIDANAATITFSRAGHNPLFYLRHSQERILSLKPDGIALGIEKGEIFDKAIKEERMNLEKDDIIIFYTDGFTEAMNKNLEEYGEERLCDIILRSKDKPVRHILQDIIDDVNLFVSGYPQHDDMTMVIVKVF